MSVPQNLCARVSGADAEPFYTVERLHEEEFITEEEEIPVPCKITDITNSRMIT